MYNLDTELLFPSRILPALRNIRGAPWQNLVDSVVESGPDSLELIAFVLMMARMNDCASCNSDSYRAMNGCTVCTKQSLKRFHETDQVLKEIFITTREEVKQQLQKRAIPSSR